MKTKLEITPEEALKLYPEASDALKSIFESTFGKDYFLPKKITDRIQSLKDVFSVLGITSICQTVGYSQSKEDKCLAAQVILFHVVKAYNEGWVADWKNTNQYKYYPYLYQNSDGVFFSGYDYWYSFHYFPSGLAFKSSELAIDAITKFRSLYEDYLMVS